jgi:hypothetical protein
VSPRPRILAAAGLAALALALPAPGSAGQTGGTLIDRIVTFSTLTYDDPEAPLYVGRGRTVKVGKGIEFNLEQEGVQNGLDVVPVIVEIGETRVEVDFSFTPPGVFADTVFNGYVLAFATDCVLFQGGTIDRAVTNLPVADDAVSFDRGTLYIDVSGLSFDRKSRLAVDLDVTDCPMS